MLGEPTPYRMPGLFSSEQIRAAVALLDWTDAELARRAGVSAERVEASALTGECLELEECEAIARAFASAGVVAVSEEVRGVTVGAAAPAGEGVRFVRTERERDSLGNTDHEVLEWRALERRARETAHQESETAKRRRAWSEEEALRRVASGKSGANAVRQADPLAHGDE